MATHRTTYKLTGTAIGLFFFATIPAGILAFVAWNIYPFGLWMFLAAFAILWFSLFAFAFVREIRKTPREHQEAENFEKLKPLIESGQQLVYESNVILDADDRKALNKSFRRPLPILIIFFSVPAVFAMVISYWIFLICLVPAGLVSASWYTINVMKKRNRKVVLRGIVTNRPYHQGRETRDSQHYLMIGDKRVAVEGSLYDQYIVGDIIELHYVGWLKGDTMLIAGSVFTQHKKLTPSEYVDWVNEFAGTPATTIA